MFRSTKKLLLGLSALAALAVGGAAVAGATTSSTATGTATGGAATRPAPPFNGPAHGTAAHEDAEKAVTGDSAAKAQAAAVKSVGGGSAGAVTTDFTGSGFETTVTKTDGSKVEVHLNSAYEALPGPGARRGVPPAPGY